MDASGLRASEHIGNTSAPIIRNFAKMGWRCPVQVLVPQ
jgi:hypothetical protein